MPDTTHENQRINDPAWKKWGPYLAEREWGTVREDYSPDGNFWDSFTHDHARSRAYRWCEDGLAGLSDEKQLLCLSLALWNGNGPILKERLFGLTPNEGNHGEDVKECYYYLDATPSHSYLKMLYKYPQDSYPYESLVEENRNRNLDDAEFELNHSTIFENGRYFDVFVEYAKATPKDITMRITAYNRGSESAPLHIIPQAWFRNTWSWDDKHERPEMKLEGDHLTVHHPDLVDYKIYIDGGPKWLLTENDTHYSRVFKTVPVQGFYKDAFHDCIVDGKMHAVRHEGSGTKAGGHLTFELGAGKSTEVLLRLTAEDLESPFSDTDALFEQRIQEADTFFTELYSDEQNEELKRIQRQAHAGMIWNKQFYHFFVWKWMKGDSGHPVQKDSKRIERLKEWEHLKTSEILSMPDTWEFPWFAAWDTAFHTVTFALTDPEFAKNQLLIFTEEWYMHPNGQLPAYEMAFGDVNPPVHAWASWRVYSIDKNKRGKGDRNFLEKIFQKLQLNFGWWVNQKDTDGLNIFQGGFLGLDNIGVFDRGVTLKDGERLDQADATSWMAMYCLDMMRIAIELALENSNYETIASKYFQHFLHIAKAINNFGPKGTGLWDDEDKFYYDVLNNHKGKGVPVKVRSVVGLIPLLAVEVIEPEVLEKLPEFNKRMQWILDNRPDLAENVPSWNVPGRGNLHMMSLLSKDRMHSIMTRVLDENEFLSDFGIRGLSRHHLENPYKFTFHGQELTVTYEPGEGHTAMFGGNSNWRGPVWFPTNYLLVHAFREYHRYFGDSFTMPCASSEKKELTFGEIADEISRRLICIFEINESGNRPVNGDIEPPSDPENWENYILFHEYFHGDTGRGCGASHQTGWTGLVSNIIKELYE
jgi:glycogen debranching enzyme